MKHITPLPKTELEKIRNECKAQGLDYDKLPINVESDINGNIIKITNGYPKLEQTFTDIIDGEKTIKKVVISAIPANAKFNQILKKYGIE